MFILNLLFIPLVLEFSPELTLSVIVTVVIQIIAFITAFVTTKLDVTNLKANDLEKKTAIAALETKLEMKFNTLLAEITKLREDILNLKGDLKECKALNHNK
jgi:hypothetical protein